jgi:hypothetical protein
MQGVSPLIVGARTFIQVRKSIRAIGITSLKANGSSRLKTISYAGSCPAFTDEALNP